MGNSIAIPEVGFGVYQIPSTQTKNIVRFALDAGYRHIDTAEVYGNEAEVGQAVRESGLSREEIYITTKLNPWKLGYESTISEFEKSLAKLRSDYVDLYLLHWPSPTKEKYLESWQACEKLKAEGKIGAIGVSNLTISQLEWLSENSETLPSVNQVEIHPHFQQTELRRYHDLHGILTEAWSPIAHGKCLKDSTLIQIALKHGKTAAQVALRWHIQIGNFTLSKSVTPSRIKENLDIYDFELDAEDMNKIAKLDGDPNGAFSMTLQAGLPSWQV
jgi:2,5-diketo-D-gluconate reductase A